jgi:hypothetical protein
MLCYNIYMMLRQRPWIKKEGEKERKGERKIEGGFIPFTSTGLLLEFLDSLESYELQLLA